MTGEQPPLAPQDPWAHKPWERFAVRPGATAEEARQVMRSAARTLHPDVTRAWPEGPRQLAEATMKELTEAVEMAENEWPELRAPRAAEQPYEGVFATFGMTGAQGKTESHDASPPKKESYKQPWSLGIVRGDGFMLGKSSANGYLEHYVIDPETHRSVSKGFSKIERLAGTDFLYASDRGNVVILSLTGERLLEVPNVVEGNMGSDGKLTMKSKDGSETRIDRKGNPVA